jgi:hypothetical protein
MIHRNCGGKVRLVSRTVISRPEDQNWPQDVMVLLPWCRACGRVISVDETEKENA